MRWLGTAQTILMFIFFPDLDSAEELNAVIFGSTWCWSFSVSLLKGIEYWYQLVSPPPIFYFFFPILAGPHTFKGLFEGLRGKVRIGLCLGFGVHNEWKSTRCPHKPVCQCVCTGYTICSIQIIFLQFIGNYWISVLHFNLTVDFWLQSFERHSIILQTWLEKKTAGTYFSVFIMKNTMDK